MSFFGIYRATVMSTDDPQSQGRIQVMVPAVSTQVHWATACLPYAVGSDSIEAPAVGSTVWVAFEAGDAVRPVYLGVLPT